MKLTRIAFLMFGILACLFGNRTASATSTIPVSLAKIVEHSQSAFIGTCKSVETVETNLGWADRVTFTVSETVIGEPAADGTISWYQARMGQEIPFPGMPKYEIGKEYMVFLTAKAEGSIFQAPYALGQGSFKVERNADGQASAKNEFANEYLYSNLDVSKLQTEGAAVSAELKSKARAVGQEAPKDDELHGIANQARALSNSKNPEADFAGAASANGGPGPVKVLTTP